MRNFLVLLVLGMLSISMLSMPGEASYIPDKYREEAKQIKNDIGLYDLAVKYQHEFWAYDILRQLAQNYTNNGNIGSLHIEMLKYRR